MEKQWKTMEKRIKNGIDHDHLVSRILQPSTVTVVEMAHLVSMGIKKDPKMEAR